MQSLTEAEPLPIDFPVSVLHHGATREHLKMSNATASPEWFGLNFDKGHEELGFFVGVGRLPVPGSPVLNVGPRFEHIDYAAMFARCAADPVVSGNLDRTFTVWPDREPVPVEEAQHDWFARLLVYASLNATARLCARHLRRGSVRVVENLQGRVKGRVLVGEQVRQNLSRMRADRTVCSFSRFEVGILENVILRAALEVGASFLGRCPIPNVDKAVLPAIAAARAALSGVAVRRIHARDHLSARTTGVMAAYRTPLRLARAVLDHLGLDPENLHASPEPRGVPPFALCTYELFERYCEVLLRRRYPEMEALVGEDNIGHSFRVRPDYLLHADGKGWIVDAKYKRDWNWRNEPHRDDVNQVVGYSRHRAVLGRLLALGMKPDAVPRIAVLYPAPSAKVGWDGADTLDGFAAPGFGACDDFDVPLIRVPIRLPSRGS